jgi:hypothetical protein
MPRNVANPHRAVFLDLAVTAGRITIPKDLSERLPWIASSNVHGWFYIISAGRYRLLSDDQVQDDPALGAIRRLVLEGKSSEDQTEASQADPESHDSIVARLWPLSVGLQDQKWRLTLPNELLSLLPPGCNPRSVSILLTPEGYWEIWYTDVLRKALDSPPNKR